MRNFTKVHVAQDARTELHDKLSLTGAEISEQSSGRGWRSVCSFAQKE